MSSEAIGYVFKRSPFKGTAYSVHLAIADSVNDQNDNEFWLSMSKLAKKARTTRSTAQEVMGTLINKGFLHLVQSGQKAGMPSRYRFLFPDYPIVYDSQEVSRKTTGVSVVSTRGGVPKADTEPKEDLESKAPSGAAAPPNGDRPTPEVRELVAHYVSTAKAIGVEPTTRFKARVGAAVRELLLDGKDPKFIKAAVEQVATQNKSPQSLVYVVADLERDVHTLKAGRAS